MGTEKRERQKANRAKRREVEARTQRNSRLRRTILQWGIGIAAAFAAVLLIAYFTGAIGSGDENVADTTIPPDQSLVPIDSLPVASLPESTGECPATDGSSPQTMTFASAQPFCIDPNKTYTAEIVTNKGTVVADLFVDLAPQTVNNFVNLSRFHYYDGISCHRIIPGFMAQCGDPTGTGSGGPGYSFPDELPAAGEYKIGSLAMANSGPNTQGSQFFIVTGPTGESLPPDYSLFGQVTEGLDDTLAALDAVGNPDDNGQPPLEEVTIESITITES